MSVYTGNHKSVKLNIQTTGIKLSDYLKAKIHSMIKKLKKYLPEISWMDMYLKNTKDAVRPMGMTVRFGVPGPDIVLSDYGLNWKTLLKNIERRTIRQLEKRKGKLTITSLPH